MKEEMHGEKSQIKPHVAQGLNVTKRLPGNTMLAIYKIYCVYTDKNAHN